MAGQRIRRRRGLLRLSAGVPANRAALAAPAVIKGTRLTYWGGLIFSDKANRLLVDRVTRRGSASFVQTEVVMINQNETVRRLSAAPTPWATCRACCA